MHRKVRKYLKKSLGGILSAAMILTSLSVPDMTVRAAEVLVTEENKMPDEPVESDEMKVSENAAEFDEMKASEETEASGEMKAPEETEATQTSETTGAIDTEPINVKETEETSTNSIESEIQEMSSTMDEKDTEEDTSSIKDSSSEETEDFDSVILNEADENGNYVINGDFENETESWTVENITLRDNSGDKQNIGTNSSKCMYIWSENGTDISMSQSMILGEGIYKASIEAGGKL